MEDMEYSDLTRALEGTAAMSHDHAPALDTKDPIQGTIAGMPSVVRRTMDFLGFRRSQEVAVADAMVGLLPIWTAQSTSSSSMSLQHVISLAKQSSPVKVSSWCTDESCQW